MFTAGADFRGCWLVSVSIKYYLRDETPETMLVTKFRAPQNDIVTEDMTIEGSRKFTGQRIKMSQDWQTQ